MEHPNDADEAASVVISEIFPLSSSPNFTQPRNNQPQLKGITNFVSSTLEISSNIFICSALTKRRRS